MYSEEQQLEAIKEWWNENKTAVIVGVLLGAAGLFGWQSWEKQQRIHFEEASAKYNHLLSDAEEQKFAKVDEHTDELLNDYDDTPYAEMAALAAAKGSVINEKLDAAKERLEWVINNAKMPESQQLAQLRLVRVYIVNKEYEPAKALLSKQYPESYATIVNELMGDLNVAKGDIEAAKTSYDKALNDESLLSEQRKTLQMKRDDLGNITESSE